MFLDIIRQEILLACLGTPELFKMALGRLCSETEFRGQLSLKMSLHKWLSCLVQHLAVHRDNTNTKTNNKTKNVNKHI